METYLRPRGSAAYCLHMPFPPFTLPPSRHCRDARVYGHTTTAVHDMSTPPPPSLMIRPSAWYGIIYLPGVSFVSWLFTAVRARTRVRSTAATAAVQPWGFVVRAFTTSIVVGSTEPIYWSFAVLAFTATTVVTVRNTGATVYRLELVARAFDRYDSNYALSTAIEFRIPFSMEIAYEYENLSAMPTRRNCGWGEDEYDTYGAASSAHAHTHALARVLCLPFCFAFFLGFCSLV